MNAIVSEANNINPEALVAVLPHIRAAKDVLACHRLNDGTVFVRMKITPLQARDWNRHENIRPLIEERASDFARLIKNGHWNPNAGLFLFNAEGKLIAGQHRTRGIYSANEIVEGTALFFVSDASAYDSNRGAVGKPCHYMSGSDRQLKQSTARVLISLQTGTDFHIVPHVADIERVIQENEPHFSTVFSLLSRQVRGVRTADVLGALIYVRPVATELVDTLATLLSRDSIFAGTIEELFAPVVAALKGKALRASRDIGKARRGFILNGLQAVATGKRKLPIKKVEGKRGACIPKAWGDGAKQFWDTLREKQGLPVPRADKAVDASVLHWKAAKTDSAINFVDELLS